MSSCKCTVKVTIPGQQDQGQRNEVEENQRGTKEEKEGKAEDVIASLHSYFTCNLLIAFSVIISFKQFG
ncbi:unnamed protein product, partial [Brugia timori]|uniref:CSRNP_N domain-containing protein n=1 Tax=Brugia timori TaxID=42155 RepID=A0A0R3QKN4_9BILA